MWKNKKKRVEKINLNVKDFFFDYKKIFLNHLGKFVFYYPLTVFFFQFKK